MGGICNSSGGSLVKRGPAFTRHALFAHLSGDGELRLVNHLGIDLGDDPEAILSRLDRGDFADHAIASTAERDNVTHNYDAYVRDIDADSPARFNADPRMLYEASGSAGRVITFAVRLPTFPADEKSTTFYIGTNDPHELGALRRHMLEHFADLPVSAEYMHVEAYRIAEKYGKDTVLAINWLGVGNLPRLFAAKSAFDNLLARLGIKSEGLSDRLPAMGQQIVPKAFAQIHDRLSRSL